MINPLRLLLLAQPTITAIVVDRGFVDIAANGSKLPRFVLHQMSSDEQNDLENSGDARQLNFDIDCEGETAQDAWDLATAIREFLKDYAGATQAGQPDITACVLNDERSKKPERTTAAGAVRQFAVTIDVDVFYAT